MTVKLFFPALKISTRLSRKEEAVHYLEPHTAWSGISCPLRLRSHPCMGSGTNRKPVAAVLHEAGQGNPPLVLSTLKAFLPHLIIFMELCVLCKTCVQLAPSIPYPVEQAKSSKFILITCLQQERWGAWVEQLGRWCTGEGNKWRGCPIATSPSLLPEAKGSTGYTAEPAMMGIMKLTSHSGS